MTVASHSRNGIYLDFRSGTDPTRHVDIRTCPLRDIGPPRLRSRAVDTNCPTARRFACVMRPDSESRCRVADGVVDQCGRPIRAHRCRDWLAGLAAKRATPCSVTRRDYCAHRVRCDYRGHRDCRVRRGHARANSTRSLNTFS